VAQVKSPDELTEAFRRQGLKVTPQRQCIFRALHRNPEHPSAEAVYEVVRAEMPTISLRTVYQTLNDLAAMGELHQLTLGPGSARFDPNLDAHHHLVCDGCGQVADVYADVSGVEVAPEGRQGFTITTTQVVFRGLCPACSARAADPTRRSTPSSTSSSITTNQHEETLHA
jgi:Fur family transcriptional regulator, peroxide stress response regulator